MKHKFYLNKNAYIFNKHAFYSVLKDLGIESQTLSYISLKLINFLYEKVPKIMKLGDLALGKRSVPERER